VDGAEAEQIGNHVQWTAKPGNEAPAWCVSKPMGFTIKENKAAVICFQLKTHATFIGTLSIPLSEMLGQGLVTLEFKSRRTSQHSRNVSEKGAKLSSISFQVVDQASVIHRRTVFFIRHAESAWNKAQSKHNFYEMFKTRDHPLSQEGREQAESLDKRIRAIANEPKDSPNAAILTPDVIYVSPLTRAVQTAVIALQPVFKMNSEIVFMASAREKQNFLGMDTKGSVSGPYVVQRTLNETRQLYQNSVDKSIPESFRDLKFDMQEVQEEWWHSSSKESKAQLEGRLDEFMSQLLYSPNDAMIVVGHSHFFREVFKTYLSDAFCSRQPSFAERLKTWKLMNCGVVRVELDPSLIPDSPIVNVELVLDTHMLVPKPGIITRCCCCSGRQPPANGDPRQHSGFDERGTPDYPEPREAMATE